MRYEMELECRIMNAGCGIDLWQEHYLECRPEQSEGSGVFNYEMYLTKDVENYELISILLTMALLFFLIFFAWFISAVIRGKFSYGKVDYDFHEHPVQYTIVCIFLLGVSAGCLYRFLVEMEWL